MTSIRTATLNDVGTIHRLGESVSEFSVSGTTVTFWPEDVLQDAIESDDVVVLVAEDQQQIVGFIIASYSRGLLKTTIENIYVIPENRSKGLGDKMLATLLQVLSERKCEYVATLIPTDARNALSLYERAGFTRGETLLWLDKSLSDNFKSAR